MRSSRVILLVLSGTLALAACPCLADPLETGGPVLGRLFLTPEWRATIERQRQLNLQQSRAMEGEQIRLDGVVVRSSGKSTVWINGQPQTESSRDTGVSTALSRRSPGQATLATGMAASVDLKVGVTLDQATGKKHGGLTNGEIRVHRRAIPRP